MSLHSATPPSAPDDPTRFDRVVLPAYDPTQLTPAIVHFGVGGFHRAHQALYLDELATAGHHDWGLVGVGIRHRDLADTLTAQGHLFTVVERGGGTDCARVIGVMTETLVLADDPSAVVDRLSDPRTRLVTFTVTGDGYDVTAEDSAGRMIFTAVVDALDRRHREGLPAFTVLSCDNLPDAGAAARRATLMLAAERNSSLAKWIADNATFPASMVDRITPATSPEDRAAVTHEFALQDDSPVITEPFAQWVIEDAFCNGRPPLDEVGARFVADVGPYKLIKSRMLNGGHCALGYLGYLAGYRRSDEAMADPAIAEFLDRLLADEIAPLLPQDVPGMQLAEYRRTLLERFDNPAVGDQLSRLCRRGSTKMSDYLLPSAVAAAASHRPRALLTLVVAAWLRYLRGEDLAGEPIDVIDPRADELLALAERDPAAVLRIEDIFGPLAGDTAFAADVRAAIDLLDSSGVQQAIRTTMAGIEDRTSRRSA